MDDMKRVLVVDDESAIRDLMDLALSCAGYEVVTAEDGAQALAILDAALPNLILLDMRMPIMDGWAFAQAYKEHAGPKAPIVVCTAARDAATSAAQVWAAGFLAKPFNLTDLYACVARYSR